MVFSISPALVFTVSFQSTLPVWGATFTSSRSFFKSKISIHAPRVGSDKFIIWYDGQKFKTGRAVNSLTTTAQGKGDAFKKIKIVEVMDLIKQDITRTAEDQFIGKYPNSYDNRCLLISGIKGYLDSLAADEILGPNPVVEIDLEANRKWLQENGFDVSAMTEQEIKEANTGSAVNLRATIQILDVIEDINLPILLNQ